MYWISWKNKDQPKSVIQSGMRTYYATAKELAEYLGWCEKKIRMSVNALIELGIIGLTHNQKYKMDRTKHFFFGRDQYKKLIELCVKNSICLAHIGLPQEIMQMLAAFSETVPCPCSGQMVKMPIANGKNDQLQTVKIPNAFGKNDHLKTKITDKDSNLDINKERMNRESQQKENVDSSRPSTRPSKSSQKFSSEDEKPEEVTLTELGQHIFEFACKTLFKAKKPKITQKIKDECELLASHVKTFKQFESLLQYVQSKFDAPYHLKNMTNELNDWLQIQNTASKDMQGLEWLPVSDTESEATEADAIGESTSETHEPDATENVPQTVEDAIEDIETTDQQLIDKMQYICHDYEQDTSIDVCLDALSNVREEFSLNNTTLFDFMTEAYRANLHARTCDVQAFFDELYGSLAGAFDRQEQMSAVV
jgi:hypothetical protein